MKLLIAICVVVLLLQLATVGIHVSSGDREQPSADAIEDGDWDPAAAVPLGGTFEALLDPFRPRLELPWDDDTKAFPGGTNEVVVFKGGSDDQRVAKFELTAGTGILIRYDCSRDGAQCPQIVCLCPANEPLAAEDFSVCGDGLRPRDGKCPSDGNRAEIVVYGETGELRFAGLGDLGATVRQR